MVRRRGGETVQREDIRKFGEEVRDVLSSGEKVCMETGGQEWSSRGKVNLRRTRRGRKETPLIFYI